MRVANVIVAHDKPGQLARLIKRFPAEAFHNFVHVDARRRLAEFAEVGSLPHVTLLPRRRRLVYTGNGFVEVVLDAMRFIFEINKEFQYLSIMSGQDYPLRSTADLAAHLAATYPVEYFQVADMTEWPEGVSRYRRYHLNDWTFQGRFKGRIGGELTNLINRWRGERDFYPGLVPHGKSSWFTCTDRFARHCLAFVRDNPGYVRFMKSVWVPDEIFFNTILMNSHFREHRAGGNLRHIVFTPGHIRPQTFTLGSYDELVASGQFLARKFDAGVDADVLDALDRRIQ